MGSRAGARVLPVNEAARVACEAGAWRVPSCDVSPDSRKSLHFLRTLPICRCNASRRVAAPDGQKSKTFRRDHNISHNLADETPVAIVRIKWLKHAIYGAQDPTTEPREAPRTHKHGPLQARMIRATSEVITRGGYGEF